MNTDWRKRPFQITGWMLWGEAFVGRTRRLFSKLIFPEGIDGPVTCSVKLTELATPGLVDVTDPDYPYYVEWRTVLQLERGVLTKPGDVSAWEGLPHDLVMLAFALQDVVWIFASMDPSAPLDVTFILKRDAPGEPLSFTASKSWRMLEGGMPLVGIDYQRSELIVRAIDDNDEPVSIDYGTVHPADLQDFSVMLDEMLAKSGSQRPFGTYTPGPDGMLGVLSFHKVRDALTDGLYERIASDFTLELRRSPIYGMVAVTFKNAVRLPREGYVPSRDPRIWTWPKDARHRSDEPFQVDGLVSVRQLAAVVHGATGVVMEDWITRAKGTIMFTDAEREELGPWLDRLQEVSGSIL